MPQAESATRADPATRVTELEETLRHLSARLRIAEAFAAGPTGIAATVTLCHTLARRPVVLIDPRGRVVASAPLDRTSAWATSVSRALANAPSAESVTIPPDSHSLIRHRLLAAPVLGDDQHGWLIFEERGSALTPEDQAVAQLASARLASEFRTQKRIARVVHDARSALARQLIRGTGCLSDLRASAEYLGVGLDQPRVLVHVLDPAREATIADDDLADALMRRLDTDVLHSRGSEGLLLLIEQPAGQRVPDFTQRVRAAVHAQLPIGLVAGISGVAELPALERAYREAREVAHCVARFRRPGNRTVLTVDDLGPARLFLANSDVQALHRYVGDVLGPLLTGGQAHTDLLLTLQVWFDTSRSVRACATRLHVHENTIRLRLARVQSITGLDVGSSNDQLSLQTALLIARLQGHSALPDFEDPSSKTDVRCTA